MRWRAEEDADAAVMAGLDQLNLALMLLTFTLFCPSILQSPDLASLAFAS